MLARKLISAISGIPISLTVLSPALAADKNETEWKVTEAQEPDGKAWEDPARLSFAIDPNGEDIFSAQINIEVGKKLNKARTLSDPKFRIGRDSSLNGYARWNRESGGDDKQNNIELGAVLKVGRNLANLYGVDDDFDQLTAQERSDLADKRSGNIDFSTALGIGYARTASYADLTAAPCDATPSLIQCQTQHKESIRAKGEMAFYSPNWHGVNRVFDKKSEQETKPSFAYIFSPKVGVAYDHLLNSPIDPSTNIVQRGSYFSVVAGVKAEFSPSFIDPRFEISLDAQLRQAVARSGSRKPSIDKSAERFELSATYYPILPGDVTDSQMRLGIGITYTHGHDPLSGEPKGDKIVLALRAGFY